MIYSDKKAKMAFISRKLFLLLVVGFLPICINGQTIDDFNIDRISISEGLESDNTHDIQKDSLGYLYVLTDGSLQKYDGWKFNEIISLTDLKIKPTGFILNNSVVIFYNIIGHSGFRRAKLNKIAVFNMHTKEIKYITDDVNQSQDLFLFKKPDGNQIINEAYEQIYFSEDLTLKIKNKRLITHSTFDTLLYLKNNTLEEFALISSAQMNDSITYHLIYNQNEKQLLKQNRSNKTILRVYDIDHAKISHCTQLMKYREFLFLFSLNDSHTTFYQTTNKKSVSVTELLSPYMNFCITSGYNFDKNNHLWLSTNRGLYVMKLNRVGAFNSFSKNAFISFRGMAEWSKDSILASTYSGIKILDLKNKKLVKKSFNKDETIYITLLKKNQNGTYILGGSNTIISTYDKHTQEFHNITVPATSPIGVKNIYNFLFEFENKLYTSTNTWVYEIVEENKIESLSAFEELDFILNIKNTIPIDSTVFICAEEGLFKLDIKTQKISRLINDVTIYFIAKDNSESNVFWLSSNRGLLKWNSATNKKTYVTTENGLSSNIITAIYQDDYNNLWCPSFYGLMKISKDLKNISNYFEENGLPNNEFNFYSHYQLEDGSLLFGTITDAIYFHPKDFRNDNESVHNEIILDINFYKKDKIIKSDRYINNVDPIVFKNSYTRMDINVFDAHLIGKSVNIIRYNISSKSKDIRKPQWNQKFDNLLSFEKLSPGNYDIEIQLRQEDNTWSNSISIPIEYKPPFHLNPIVRVLSLLSVILFGKWFYTQRLNKIDKKNKALEEIVSQRTKELNNQIVSKNKMFTIIAHDLRNPISSLKNITEKVNYLVQNDQAFRVAELTDHLDRKLDSLDKNLSNILTWVTAEKDTLPVNAIEIEWLALINRTIDLYYAEITSKKLKITVNVKDYITIYADETAAETILRNIIDNAIKYSPVGGEIKIFVENWTPQKVVTIIKDEGPGINASKKKEDGFQLGLTIVRDLLNLNNGEIKFISKPKNGTRVEITLPTSSSF